MPYNGSNFTQAQHDCLWAGDQDKVLTNLVNFATVVHKPIGIGEFGVIDRSDGHGGGDDPYWIADFSAWIKANNVAWASYFNFNSGGNSVLSDFPNSLAAFRVRPRVSDLGYAARCGYHEMVCGLSSWKVVLPTCHVTEGIRALGTTVMVPWTWGSTKLNVMCCDAPCGMSMVAPSRMVGPSAPLVTTDRAEGDEIWRAYPGRLTVAIPTYSP